MEEQEIQPKSPRQVADEVRIILHDMCGNITKAAARLGVSKQTMTYYLSGKAYFTPAAAAKFANEFQLSPAFMMRGEGAIFDKTVKIADSYAEMYHDALDEINANENLIRDQAAKIAELQTLVIKLYRERDAALEELRALRARVGVQQ